MSIEQKYRTLVERLYDKTNSKALSWTYDRGLDRVSTEVAGRTISIHQKQNQNLEPLIIISITSANGRVETFDDEYISGPLTEVPAYPTYFALMEALRNIALRRATGADDDIDAILDELEDEPPF